jgi:hypothetical protein
VVYSCTNAIEGGFFAVPLSDCRYCPDLIPPDHVKLDGHGASSLADIERLPSAAP